MVADLAGEPVEKFGVSRGGAHDAEVAGGGGEAAAKVVLPEAIGNDAAGEGIVGADKPFGEGGAAKCGVRSAKCGIGGSLWLGGSLALPNRGDAGKVGGQFEAGAFVVAADPEAGRLRIFLID